MKVLFATLFASIALFASPILAADAPAQGAPAKDALKENAKADVAPLETACAAEGSKAACLGKKGNEFGQCLRKYKLEHKTELRYSPACRTAMTAWRAEKKAEALTKPRPKEVVPVDDAEKINSACRADSITANCGKLKADDGMLPCLKKFRLEHEGTVYSQACRDAIKTMREKKKRAKNATEKPADPGTPVAAPAAVAPAPPAVPPAPAPSPAVGH